MATDRLRDVWHGIDLANLQKDLDVDAQDIDRRRQLSDSSRKSLVDACKDYREKTPADVRKQVASLIKQFQAEIDSLSKRSKAAENAFFVVYKRLANAPDPVPLIDSVLNDKAKLTASKELEIQNNKLRETVEDYQKEFAEVKNQEVTINRLKDQLRDYEDNLEETIEARVKDQQRQLQRTFDEQAREHQEQQVAMATKLGQAEQHAAVLQAALDSTQSELYDLKARIDEEAGAHQAAIEMVSHDHERATQRADGLQKELELERERMAALSEDHASGVGGSGMQQRLGELDKHNLEQELIAKDREISHLIEEHRTVQGQYAQFKQHAEQRAQTLEAAGDAKQQEIQELEAVMAARADYDDIRRELHMLKLIEFGEKALSGADSGGGAGGSSATSTKPLEVLLLEKNRTIEADNLRLKDEAAEHQAYLRELQAQHSEVESAIQVRDQLIVRLEGDLSNVKAVTSHSRGQGEGQATEHGGTAGPSTEELLTGVAAEDGSSGPASTTDTILPIVSSQRDRFRQRNIELEAEARHAQQTHTSLRNEIDTMRSDNVKLYEKIRFLQSYQSGRTPSGNDEGTVGRYSSDYEEHINPFRQFNHREKQRKYASLSPTDKITLSIGRAIMTNPYARLMFVLYAALLHLITFLVLYKYSHSEGGACSSLHQLAAAGAGVGVGSHHHALLPGGA